LIKKVNFIRFFGLFLQKNQTFMSKRIKIFVSYSHQNTDRVDEKGKYQWNQCIYK